MVNTVIVKDENGGYSSQSLVNAGAVAAAASGGLDLVAGEMSLKSNSDGSGLTLAGGIYDVTLAGRGVKTAISTAGAGTLTAAAIVGGLIMRTGPTGAYNDTTATATEILAAMKDPKVGDSFEFTIVNGVAYIGTMVAGASVTLAGVTANAASKVRRYHAQVTNVGTPAVTITGIGEMVA